MQNPGFFTAYHDKAAAVTAAGWLLCMLATTSTMFCGGCGGQQGKSTANRPDACPAACGETRTDACSAPPQTKSIKHVGPPLADLEDRTTWDSCFMYGKKIGYSRTSVSHEHDNGQTIVKINFYSHLSIKRFGELTEMKIELVNSQTTDGRLIDFQTRMTTGDVPLVTRGCVEGDKLIIETSSQSARRITSIPWSQNILGMFGVEQMLLSDPMRPGQRRSIRSLMPIINQVAVTTLNARDYEPVELATGTCRLLRIDTTARLPNGRQMQGTIWTDRKGDTLKTYSKAADQELIRTTQADALDKTGLGEIDLGLETKIHTQRPLREEEIVHKARYRVHVDDEDPAALFVESHAQQVESLGPETAVVTVYALRPGDANGNPHVLSILPNRDDIEPNSIVQSDNPRIIAMAEEAAGEIKDPWQTAVALERYVKAHITRKDMATVFATAAEVAESRQGDCTEHAVLLAALARARGIPARGAVGLVYLSEEQAFFYHMWTEVFVENRWIPLDATIAKGGVGAARLTLSHSNLKGASTFGSFLPVANVLGRMKIEVLDDEDSSEHQKEQTDNKDVLEFRRTEKTKESP